MRFWGALFLSLSVTGLGFSQTTATIVGTVTDPSGGVVSGVKISITSEQTGLKREVTTNDRGVYVVPSLPVGSYAVSAEVAGFKRKTLTGVGWS